MVLFGGFGGAELGDLWALDTLTGSWELLWDHGDGTPGPCARSSHVSWSHGCHVYVGFGGSGSHVLGDLWRFDVRRGCWDLVHDAATSPAAATSAATAGSPRARAKANGSASAKGSRVSPSNGRTQVEVIAAGVDPATGNPRPRRAAAVAVVGASAVLFGGFGQGGETFGLEVHIFDSAEVRIGEAGPVWRAVEPRFRSRLSPWGAVNDRPGPRHSHIACALGLDLIIFGGAVGANSSTREHASDTWVLGLEGVVDDLAEDVGKWAMESFFFFFFGNLFY
jgi:hypothetical protein